jgi:hypothetical protein
MTEHSKVFPVGDVSDLAVAVRDAVLHELSLTASKKVAKAALANLDEQKKLVLALTTPMAHLMKLGKVAEANRIPTRLGGRAMTFVLDHGIDGVTRLFVDIA